MTEIHFATGTLRSDDGYAVEIGIGRRPGTTPLRGTISIALDGWKLDQLEIAVKRLIPLIRSTLPEVDPRQIKPVSQARVRESHTWQVHAWRAAPAPPAGQRRSEKAADAKPAAAPPPTDDGLASVFARMRSEPPPAPLSRHPLRFTNLDRNPVAPRPESGAAAARDRPEPVQLPRQAYEQRFVPGRLNATGEPVIDGDHGPKLRRGGLAVLFRRLAANALL